MDQVSKKLDNLHLALYSAHPSPTLSPFLQPYLLSPGSQTPSSNPSDPSPSPKAGPIHQPGSTSAQALPGISDKTQAQSQAVTPLELPPSSTFDIKDWIPRHDIDDELQFPDSFPGTTPGDEYRHVKLASIKEQQQFVAQLTAHATFIEMFVLPPTAGECVLADPVAAPSNRSRLSTKEQRLQTRL